MSAHATVIAKHICALAEACRAASFVMLQELFQSALLNWLCIYSALKWTELPAEERVFEKLSELKVGTGPEGDANNVDDDEDEVCLIEHCFFFPFFPRLRFQH